MYLIFQTESVLNSLNYLVQNECRKINTFIIIGTDIVEICMYVTNIKMYVC